MSQSLARLHIHLVFSTKNRANLIAEARRETLHAYMAKVLQNLGCTPVLINSVEDHAHMLFDLARTQSIAHVVEIVKASSSKWIKSQGTEFARFAWQSGYGAFAVSESRIDATRAYVADQREHHRKLTFEEEFRLLLERHGLAYDEKHLWD